MAPYDIKTGTSWVNELKFQVQNCDTVLAIISNHFHYTDWTEQEIGLGWEFGKRIIGITPDGNTGTGYTHLYQIKPINPKLVTWEIIDLVFDIYPNIENKDEFVERILKYNLLTSESFVESIAIHHLVMRLTKKSFITLAYT